MIDPNLPVVDDLSLNQGGDDYWAVPEERRQEEREEANVLGASYPILPEIVAWFDEQVAMCDSIDNIDLESNVPVESQMLAYKMLKTLLESKQVEFRDYRQDA